MSRTCLFDTNVLIALLWPDHEFHALAQRWFSQHGAQGWATCALTQSGFIRIVSNPSFSRLAPSVQDALEVLRGSIRHAGHRFWTADIGIDEALDYFETPIVGSKQVMDAYLVGLTIHKRGKLVTLDRRILGLLGEQAERDMVIVL